MHTYTEDKVDAAVRQAIVAWRIYGDLDIEDDEEGFAELVKSVLRTSYPASPPANPA